MDIPPPSTLPPLIHLSHLLHLLHHRNKNQHRHSIWYRHFQLFRSQLLHLIHDLETLAPLSNSDTNPPISHLARTRKKAKDATTTARTRQRLEFWRDVMVPRWQHAFSQVVADGRFGVVGVVLYAALSEVCGLVGVTAALEEVAEREMREVLEGFGREEWGGSGGVGWEDRGVVVRRGEEGVASTGLGGVGEMGRDRIEGDDSGGHDNEDACQTPQVLPAPTPEVYSSKEDKKRNGVPSANSKKKRRKAGNAIDDIFG